jgi:mannose-6-phosphate isomerase-like protein (cupin superfamily)
MQKGGCYAVDNLRNPDSALADRNGFFIYHGWSDSYSARNCYYKCFGKRYSRTEGRLSDIAGNKNTWRKQMKTKNDGHRIIRFMALTFLTSVCMLAMGLVITPCSYADSAIGKMAANAPVGQTNERGVVVKGYAHNIEDLTVKNEDFRHVLYTTKQSQFVLMALRPKGEIGEETHKADQFFRVEVGTGEAVISGVLTVIRAGFAIIIPGGTKHNIINTGTVPMKLYTIYSPPNHRDGVIHHTRAEAEADNEHFDGKTTE